MAAIFIVMKHHNFLITIKPSLPERLLPQEFTSVWISEIVQISSIVDKTTLFCFGLTLAADAKKKQKTIKLLWLSSSGTVGSFLQLRFGC